MKKLFFAAAVAAMTFASCNNEEMMINNPVDETQYEEMTLTMDANEMASTRGLTGYGTANKMSVPANHVLRFVIQVYDANNEKFGPCYIVNDEYDGDDSDGSIFTGGDSDGAIELKVRVPKGADFNVAAWADIVSNAKWTSHAATITGDPADTDVLYDTSDLKNVNIKNPATYNVPAFTDYTYFATEGDPNSGAVALSEAAVLDYRDAFYQKLTVEYTKFSGTTDVKVAGVNTYKETVGNKAVSLHLLRPFARINIITLDADFLNGATVKPTSSEISYTNGKTGDYRGFCAVFNVYSGAPVWGTDNVNSKAHITVAKTPFPTWGTFNIGDKIHLGVDYIFAELKPTNEWLLQDFTFKTVNGSNYNTDGTEDGAPGNLFSKQDLTSIPYAQNYITNIYGNFLTDEATLRIEVLDPFYKPDYNVNEYGIKVTTSGVVDETKLLNNVLGVVAGGLATAVSGNASFLDNASSGLIVIGKLDATDITALKTWFNNLSLGDKLDLSRVSYSAGFETALADLKALANENAPGFDAGIYTKKN